MLRSIALSSVIALTALGAAPALAGFEWVPPANEPAPMPAAPQPSAQDVMAAPVQGWGMAQSPEQYALQAQMMQQSMAPSAPAPQAYPPPQNTGYYAGASAYPNPVPPAPPPSASAGGLTINPYPLVPAGYAPSMMNTGSVEGAIMSETRVLNPLQLGGGLNTGGKARPMEPSVPAAAPSQTMTIGAPQVLAPGMNANMPGMTMSAMPGGPLQPLPGMGMPVSAAPVMQAPVAPPPAPVAAAPLQPPPMRSPVTDTSYPAPAPTSVQAFQPAVAAAAPGGKFDEAVGFGNDLPLALALSQVIPGDFALFFETAIDAETNVSWQGGKPWNQVLQEMLAPLGLRAEIQPNLVMIRRA